MSRDRARAHLPGSRQPPPDDRPRLLGRAPDCPFAIAGFVAGLSGVLGVWYRGNISPGVVDLTRTIDVLIVAVIGGLGYPIGAFIGAVVFVLIDVFASSVELFGFSFDERFNTLIGLFFVVVVLVAPNGLVGLADRIWGRSVGADAGCRGLSTRRHGSRRPTLPLPVLARPRTRRPCSPSSPIAGPAIHPPRPVATRRRDGTPGLPTVTHTVREARDRRQMLQSLTGRKLVTLMIAGVIAASLAGCNTGTTEKTPIKIGGLATLEGPFAVPGQDSFRGIEQALNDLAPKNSAGNWVIAGREITLIKEGSDATPAVAVEKAKKLIEQDDADISSALSRRGPGGRDYAKTVPDKTFVNGSRAQDTRSGSRPELLPVLHRGAQWQAGLGSYAFTTKGYTNVATVAEDYSFPYTQVGGFMYEFCAAGGHVVQKNWVPLGTADYASVVSNLPTSGIDAIYVALGGADAINFLTAYQGVGGTAPMVGGSITVDQTVLGAQANIPEDYILGTPSAGPIADNNTEPAWLASSAHTRRRSCRPVASSPSLFAHAYYIETAVALLALKEVNGDLSGRRSSWRRSQSSPSRRRRGPSSSTRTATASPTSSD
jgi:branched-chain amino acid transport system substrate-binding protein